MVSYIIRRLGYAVIMVVLVSFVSFVIIKLPPGDFLTQKLAQLQARGDRSAEEQVDHLCEPASAWTNLFWCSTPPGSANFLRGILANPSIYERPVSEILLGERLGMTIILANCHPDDHLGDCHSPWGSIRRPTNTPWVIRSSQRSVSLAWECQVFCWRC